MLLSFSPLTEGNFSLDVQSSPLLDNAFMDATKTVGSHPMISVICSLLFLLSDLDILLGYTTHRLMWLGLLEYLATELRMSRRSWGGGGGGMGDTKSAPPSLLLTACFLSPAHNLVAPKSQQNITW